MISDVIRWAMKFLGYILGTIKNRVLDTFGILPRVRWIVWECTVRCNSRCQMCNIWNTEPGDAELGTEEVKKFFDDPLLKNTEAILLTGGEPILRADLLETVLYAHKKFPKARITLSTNALLADKVFNFVSTALENGVSLDVGISLDGIGEHHDIIRGVKGNFQKVELLLDKLLKLKEKYCDKLGIVLGQTLIPQTLGYIDEVKEYAAKKNVAYLAQLYDESAFYHNVGDKQLSKDSVNRMVEAVSGLTPSFHNEMLLKILRNSIIKFDCYALRSFLVLRYNGDVSSCLKYIDLSIGNVRNRSLSDIWKGAEASKRRKDIRSCRGCANTWATDWSKESNCLPFVDLMAKSFLKKRGIR